MATPYSDIYSRFLQKISDYTFLSMSQTDIEANLSGYLLSAISSFKRCKQDLTQRNQDSATFTITLSDEEIEILSVLMVVEYLSPKLVTAELLKQNLSGKDYTIYSQANHINAIKALRDGYSSEAERKIIRYTYDNADFSKLDSL
jgi:hypothetical protein